MKPLNDLSDAEFEAWVRRAAVLPDAPRDWVLRAKRAFAPAPVPAPAPGVGEVTRAAWRLVSATLRFDSWAASPQPAAVRALPGDVRQLLFSADGRDIDLRITPGVDRYALMGQVLGPDEAGVVELCGASDSSAPSGPAEVPMTPGPLHTAKLDELGEFRIEGIAHGTYRLTLRVGSDAIALPPIQVGEFAR